MVADSIDPFAILLTKVQKGLQVKTKLMKHISKEML